MIQLLSPLTLDGRFSAQDLPDELHLSLLNGIVVPRIVSLSMTPTIRQGDRLELGPPDSLTVGAIVVFRSSSQFVCHRITAIDEQGMLSTRGDAVQGACEAVHPSSVIGTVTGLLRGDARISVGQRRHSSSVAGGKASLKDSMRALSIDVVIRSIRALAQFSLFQSLLVLLLRWTAIADIFVPGPLQSFLSHSKVASVPLRKFSHRVGLLADANGQKPADCVIRLGPWRLAQYDLVTGSVLLRQSLHDAGLEPIVRHCCGRDEKVSD